MLCFFNFQNIGWTSVLNALLLRSNQSFLQPATNNIASLTWLSCWERTAEARTTIPSVFDPRLEHYAHDVSCTTFVRCMIKRQSSYVVLRRKLDWQRRTVAMRCRTKSIVCVAGLFQVTTSGSFLFSAI
jgi:hypothetical protein